MRQSQLWLSDNPLFSSGRTHTRAAWAAQLAQDAGLARCLVFRGGACGWRGDPSVRAYRGYRLLDPPEPEPARVDPFDAAAGAAELAALGIV